ncbi:hypothetical protein [Muricoccus radiodurans]|uniref:hypothetical protein n=1 Tax=Muricoccus radiodurans TaxID=2231721 RepID=UPI003CEB9C3B
MRAAAALLVLLAAAPAAAQPTAPQIMRMEREANTRCRGGSGDQPETQKSCGERDAYARVLNMMNWCFGRRGQVAAAHQWHRCGADSLRAN